jgi:hypothetical protein
MGRIQRGRSEDPPSGVPIYIQRPCCTNIHKSDIGLSQGTRRTIYGVGRASGSPTKSYEVVRCASKPIGGLNRGSWGSYGFVESNRGFEEIVGSSPDTSRLFCVASVIGLGEEIHKI